MADLSVTGEVVVTSEKAEAAFDRVGDKATQMANEVASAAGKAGQAVDGVGAGAEKSADKFTRAESRMRDAIKRSTQELQLLGKTASEKLEFNINAKGLDASKFAPYIEELKKAEAAQRIATGSLDKMGVSAAQTAAALRGVPAQFTDIITSLQAGQAPLTVFLQQGGQLRDMFGGAGAAAKALGGYVAGLINPFTLAAAGAAALAVAYNQGSKEADAYRLAIVSTGNAAGTTGAQLKGYAQEISGVIGTQGKAAESLAAFVSTGRVSRDVLKEASQAAIAWERATGQAVGATAKQFADLGKDPLQAVLKLNEGTNFLTESVYKQIKSLEEQGKTAEAAAVAQRAYADALTGRAGEIERNLGSIETAWNKVKDAAKAGWDAILNVGRAETNQDRLAATRKQIADLENRLAAGSGFAETAGGAATGRPSSANNDRLRAELMGLKAKEAALFGLAYAEQAAAESQAERAKQTQAAAEWDKEGAKYLSDKAKLERELTKARNEGLAAGKSQAEIEQRLAQIRESYSKKGGSGGLAAENRELRDQQRIFAELADVSSTYYTNLATAQKERAKGNISEAQYVKYVEDLIQKQPFAVALEKDRAEAIKESAKAAAESSKALSAWYEVREKESQSLQNQINARREEVSMMGMTTEAVVAYTQAKYEQQAAEKEAYAAALESASFYAGEYAEAYKTAAEAARQQAKQLRELGGLEVQKANREAAKKAKDEWERAAADIERALTDALMRGFESGKDFAKNLRDTVVNMFNTMVLRPVISAVVNPIAGAVTGALGFSGTANAATATSGVGVVGAISNGMSMLNTGINSAVQGTFSKFALSETGKSLGLSMAGPDASGYNMLSSTGQQMSQALGVVGNTLAGYAMGSMAHSLISNGYSAGKGMDTFQAVGTAVGSAIGGPLVGAAIGAGAGVFNQLFGRKHKDSGIQGTFGGTAGFEGERYDFYKGGVFRSDKTKTSPLDQDTTDALAQQFRAIQLSTGLMAETLGLASGAVASFTKDIKLSFKDLTEEQIQEKMAAEFTAISDEMAGQVLGPLHSEYAKANETASQTLNRLATSLITVNSAFDMLGVAMLDASVASGDMASQLLEQSGGGAAFAANLGTYYENFYDQAEKTAYVTEQITATLASVGLQMPKTRDEFRALVESQIALGDSGTQAVATLLSVSGAFASVVPAGNVLSETMKRLQSDTAGLQIELLRAQGDTTGADAAQRTLDTSGMSAAEVAIYDYNQSLRDQIEALDAAAAEVARQADTRAGLERQILELQGDTAALRQLEIAGMDEANVALYDRVQALQAEAQQTAIRADLERQLLELQGDTAALRLLDIAGMDAANVALYDRIQALTASQAAEQAAANKAKQVAQERYGIETNMLQLQGNTAALRARELALLDPANRADLLRLYLLQDAQEAAKAAADAERDLAAARVKSAQDAYRAAQDATGGAFDALRRSVDAERSLYESAREAAAEAAQEIKSVIDTLSGSIQDLYAGVDSTRQASAVEGSAFIARALQAARTTGYLPDAKDLSDAISQAQGALGSQNYATQFEADRAQLVMAGQLSELSDIAKPQLTAAERTLRNAENQLKTLDDILKNAQSQVDAVRGISATVGTISDALVGLQDALLSESQAKAQAQATPAPSATAPTTPTGGALSGPYAAQITDAIKAAAYTTDDRLVYDTARMLGVTSSELDKLMGWTEGTSLDWAKRNNLPAFAVGTNYVPRDMLATIHEGEAIVPKAFNPWAAGGQGLGGGNAEVVAELRALRQQNERLEARLASIEGSNSTMVTLLDDVTDGGNAMRSEVMA